MIYITQLKNYTVEELHSLPLEDNNINNDAKEKLDLIAKEILKSFVNVGYEIEYGIIDNIEGIFIYLSAPLSKSDIVVLSELSKKKNFHFNIIIGKENIKKENKNSKLEIFLN